jgi:hypothetical protein
MRKHDFTASTRYRDVGALPPRELDLLMLRGETPSLEALCGWEFRGMNTPDWANLLGIKKFIKGFYRDAAGRIFGYNEPAWQNALAGPWIARPSDAHPKRCGFYRVDTVDPTSRDNAYLHALLLDYGDGGNATLDPTSTLRDYVVRIERGSDDLLLGKAFIAAGPLRVPVSHFILERHRPSDFRR